MSVLTEDKLRPRVPVTRPHRKSRMFQPGAMALAGCALAAAVLMLAGVDAPIFAAFNLVVWLTVPGWLLLRRVPVGDPAARVVWIAMVGVVLATVLGLAMAWSGLWHPRPVAVGVLIAAAVLILRSPRMEAPCSGHGRTRARRARPVRRGSSTGLIPWLILVSALLMWGAALLATDTRPLGDLGLLAAYPATWFIAVALVLGLCVWGVVTQRGGSKWIMSASVLGLVVMLYGSASLLAGVPRLPWVYKHIAVTDYLSAGGRVDPSIDIYNRWPGFFAASAFIGRAIGFPDAAAYASWAEIGFALVDVLIVLAIARTISENPRVYWTATLVFALTNWVGQNYFAPQAFAFTLYLTMCLLALTFLRGTPVRAVMALERWSTRRLRTEDMRGSSPGRALRVAAIIAVPILQGIIAASHQLTPYVAVIALLPLFAFGFFKPRWIGPLLLAIAIAYLIPNLGYVQSSYGFFSSFDPVANASSKLSVVDPTPEAEKWQSLGVTVLTVSTGLLAVMGFVRHFLAGNVRTTLMIGWLAAAPAFTLLGQSYGGEARLRVYLFALPWLSIGVAWLFWSGPARTRKAVVGATVSLVALALLFTATYFQPESRYRVSEGDVTAAKWLDARVAKGDLVFASNSAFPLLIGPNYPLYLRSEKLNSLDWILRYSQGSVNAGDVEYYVRGFEGTAGVYLVFSDSQERSAARMGPVSPHTLRTIEEQLVSEGTTNKVFDNGSARIYQFVKTGM